MKEKIVSKIESHINHIIEKDSIDFYDFQTLCAYLSKIEADEKAKELSERDKKLKEENRARFESLAKSFIE